MYSKDCRLTIPDILKTAKAVGLDGIAITDHDTIKGAIEAEKIAEDIEIVKGAEIKTDRGEIIGYFLQDEIDAREFWEVVDEIKSQGGMVCVPHPFDYFRINRLRFDEEILKAVDAVEVRNSRCIFESFNVKAVQLAEEKDLKKTAGSDAHSLGEIGSSGVVVESLEDIRKGEVKVFGDRTPPFDLILTKLDRMWRR
jgi:hypothetical protein